ncbi:glycine/sarcosine/betaine reductase selenoprotein B family protein [Rubrobacter radiotolerans]|nr:glycine/sarcosine/betaine reductase selenoprotein B family protein [Rubrobacter radiotolerans]MDX5894728.1 glycine/sarcosine/betaine reductase selenoprotein B family protein [Rubrobacter radiotolerans]
MASLSDLKLKYRVLMRTYRYRTHDWRPGAALRKPLAEARIAVVTTAAFHLPDQPPFDESVKGGDFSYREIPSDTDLSSLGIAHKSDAFDASGIETDKNLALPLEVLRDMVRDGKAGSVNARHFSFMGSISAPERLVSRTAPEVAAMLADDGVDAVLLTPI